MSNVEQIALLGNKSKDDALVSENGTKQSNGLQDDVTEWFQNACTLVQSPEFSRFAHSTARLAVNTTVSATKACLLPVTVPIHIVSSVTNTAVSIITKPTQLVQKESASNVEETIIEQGTSRGHLMIEKILHFSHVGLLWSFAEQCTKKAIHIISHQGHSYFYSDYVPSSQNGASSSNKDFLSGTKKDHFKAYLLQVCDIPILTWKKKDGAFGSKKLSTVKESQLNDEADPVTFIEIRLEYSSLSDMETPKILYNKVTMESAFQFLCIEAILLGSTPLDILTFRNATIQRQFETTRKYLPCSVIWKAEKKTNSLLQQTKRIWKSTDQISSQKCDNSNFINANKVVTSQVILLLEKNTLIWSGMNKVVKNPQQMKKTFKEIYDPNIPFFKGYGIINASPETILELLLDNNRVQEYNEHTLGRQVIAILEDGLLSSLANQSKPEGGRNEKNKKNQFPNACVETKIVRSETKIPFTNFIIPFLTIIHAKKLEKGEGYIILSRSVEERSGEMDFKRKEPRHNNDKSSVKKNLSSSSLDEAGAASSSYPTTNEIIWGVNILRFVKECPNKTELTTVSQVQGSMIPKFLVNKIGIMGVSEFFSSLRKLYPK